MSEFKNQHCKPCEGGVRPLDENHARQHLDQVPGWHLSEDRTSILRKLKFKNFVSTMSFINTMADMAEQQDHHPDFSAGYNFCEIKYTTHAIGGLSENDFICAAKINNMLDTES